MHYLHYCTIRARPLALVLVVVALALVAGLLTALALSPSKAIRPASPASPPVPPWNALATETATSQPNAYEPRWRARTMADGERLEKPPERV